MADDSEELGQVRRPRNIGRGLGSSRGYARGTEDSADRLSEAIETPLILGGSFTDAGGQQNSPVEGRLSALIDALNERFGMNLTDADRMWFEQQQQALAEAPDVRAATSTGSDYEQFKLLVFPRIAELIIERHEGNHALLLAYADKPEFRAMVGDALIAAVFKQLGA